ncbi:hypothetical protein ACI77I_29730 [Pseudomonas sp. D47]|uniref:hypothetical protein n=1 Tax=Pseudomonas sp. D47 TaxID=3159447 RepID=UPI00387B01A7
MKIKLWPDLVEWPLEASVSGDKLTLNGEVFDFSQLKEGFLLPSTAVDSRFFVETEMIQRVGGEVCITIRLPVTHETAEEIRNPAESIVLQIKRGKVKFPDTCAPKEVEKND